MIPRVLNRKFYWLTSILARFVPMLSVFLVTRVYSPEEFGRFQILISYAGSLIPFVNLKSSFLLAKLRDDSSVRRVAVLVLWLVPILGLGASIVLYFILKVSGYNFPFLAILSIVVLWGVFEFLVNILAVLQRFELGSAGTLVQAITTEASKLILGLEHPVTSSLIVSWLFGYGFALIMILGGSTFRLFSLSLRTVSVFVLLLRRYSRLVTYRVVSSALTMLNARALIIFGAISLDAEGIGLLSIASMFVSFAATVLAQPVSKLNFTHVRLLIKKRDHEQVFREILRLGTFSFGVGLLILAFFQLSFRGLFEIAFPVHWHEAADYVLVLSFLVPFQFLSSTVIQCLSLYDREASMLFINVIVFLLYLLTFYGFREFGLSFDVALWFLVVAHSAIRFGQFYSLLIVARRAGCRTT